MSRSLKKGPYVSAKLLKRIQEMNETGEKRMLKTWSRPSTIFPDMVGHTGNIASIVRALEACDLCIGKLLEKANENFYELVITSDHGNVEMMKDENGNLLTSHTSSKVPLVICNSDIKLKPNGSLKDVIPTVIDLYEISKPKEMTGESLIIK